VQGLFRYDDWERLDLGARLRERLREREFGLVWGVFFEVILYEVICFPTLAYDIEENWKEPSF
jgi:hypothetical protein